MTSCVFMIRLGEIILRLYPEGIFWAIEPGNPENPDVTLRVAWLPRTGAPPKDFAKSRARIGACQGRRLSKHQ